MSGRCGVGNAEIAQQTFREKLDYARDYTRGLLKKIWPICSCRLSVCGAFIHGFVPQDFLVRWAGRDNPFAVPVAVALGVPLYSKRRPVSFRSCRP